MFWQLQKNNIKQKENKIDKDVLRKVLAFAKPYHYRLWWSIVLSIVLALMAPLRPYLIQYTIDHYIENKILQGIIYISIIQIGLLAIETLLRFLFMYTTNWLGQTVVNDIRLAVHKKILFQNLSYFDQNAIGTLTTRTINDVEAINDSFSDGIIAIVADILTIVAIISIMLFTDWRLTLISLSVFPILILATYFFKEAVNKSFNSVRNAVSALNAFVQEHLSGMYIIQAFSAQKREEAKFRTINKAHRDANIKSIFAYSVFFPVVEIILAISTGLLVWYGASKMLNFELTQGVIIAFTMYLNLLFRPLRMLADKFNTLQMGLIAGKRVMDVLESDEHLQNNGSITADNLKGFVRFNNVHFAYKNNIPVLKGISFEVDAGSVLALVGPTGAGKSSIISVLTGLYPIQSGRIEIDNIALNDYDIYSLRRQVGIVLQDVFLFSGTILENITLKDESIEKEHVIDVCKKLGIHDFISALPNSYSYEVMERGNSLSQGQRQLISFARTLLFNPSILILDEATSSIDSESEILIQKAIEELIRDRTAIIIAHRLSTIRRADKIVVLEQGVIKEQGTHHELLTVPYGIYAQLYEASFKEN